MRPLSFKRLALATALLATTATMPTTTFGQTKLGTNSTTVAPSAALEVESTTKGFLPPRMSSAQMSAIVNPAVGLMAYCLDCIPAGLQVYNGTAWTSIGANNNPSATFANGTLNCDTTASPVAGVYQQGRATDTTNNKTITITSNAGGNYSATTNRRNNVQFTGSGTLFSTGSGTRLRLYASGTPDSAGTFPYVVNVGGQSCTFRVTYTGQATFSTPNTSNLPAPLATNTNYGTSGYSVSLPYTNGNGASYGTTTVGPINGLSLVRTAGTYTPGGSGNVVYTLTGTYTGPNGGSVTFTLPEGMSVTIGDAIRGTLTTSGASYDTAAVNGAVAITQAEYNALKTLSGAVIGGAPQTLMDTASLPNAGGAGAYASTGFTNGGHNRYNTIPANSYVLAFSVQVEPTGGNLTGPIVKVGTSASAGYTQVYGALPAANSLAANQTVYYTYKRPTTTVNTGIGYLGFYHTGTAVIARFSSSGGYFNGGDVSTLSNTTGSGLKIQVITTPTKQW